MPESDERFDLTTLDVTRRKLRQLHAQRRSDDVAFRTSKVFTSRRFDLAQPAGARTYINAEHAIAIADENWCAFWTLVRQGVTPVAPFNLLRPAFEAGFYALWCLDPLDGRERRLRGLRLTAVDHQQRTQWLEELYKLPVPPEQREELVQTHREHLHRYQEEARQLGVPWKNVTKPNVVDSFADLRPVRASEPAVLAALRMGWRQLSGLQHGLSYALVASTDPMTIKAEIPGGYDARVVVSDHQLELAGQMTGLLQVWALSRLHELTTRPPAG